MDVLEESGLPLVNTPDSYFLPLPDCFSHWICKTRQCKKGHENDDNEDDDDGCFVFFHIFCILYKLAFRNAIAGSANGPAASGVPLWRDRTLMYNVYILRSLKDGGYYVGQTATLEKRLRLHNTGKVRSTRYRLPFVLVRKEFFSTRGEARKRENYFKKLKGGNEFRKIIGS